MLDGLTAHHPIIKPPSPPALGKRILIESVLEVPVIPAKAGIHADCFQAVDVQPSHLDSRFRGNDGDGAGMTGMVRE